MIKALQYLQAISNLKEIIIQIKKMSNLVLAIIIKKGIHFSEKNNKLNKKIFEEIKYKKIELKTV